MDPQALLPAHILVSLGQFEVLRFCACPVAHMKTKAVVFQTALCLLGIPHPGSSRFPVGFLFLSETFICLGQGAKPAG